MPDATTFGVVVAATLVLSLTPGPAVLYIVARGVEGGRPAGLVSAFGICAGGLVHVAFAAAGLSALLASSATAFAVAKWLGVAYLLWLGVSRLLGGDDQSTTTRMAGTGLRTVFWQGVLVDVLNPKVALFFLAFLPQFVEPSRGPVWTQMVLLGLTFAVVALCTDGLYALLSGTAADWLRRRNESPGFRCAGRYASGSVYLALGAATAVSGSGKD